MEIRIGKANDNDFVVDDSHVSRHHAILSKDREGQFYIEDTGSTNGTFVNEIQVVRKKISESDRIRLGDHYLLDLC
ncbi:FHA domain-containing protein, partial [Parabacteroides sp. Marseille-P3160]